MTTGGKPNGPNELLNKLDILENGCWEFRGYRTYKGYGSIRYNNQNWTAHRLSYLFFRGEITKGKMVLHTCDNPPCCNPEHLFLGTNQDNMDDMVAKGRKNTKLTDNQVAEIIILLGEYTQDAIAKLYNVSQSTIGRIAGRSGSRRYECLQVN